MQLEKIRFADAILPVSYGFLCREDFMQDFGMSHAARGLPDGSSILDVYGNVPYTQKRQTEVIL